MNTIEYDKRKGTVTMSQELAYALFDLILYPPLKRGQNVFAAQVPWSRIEKARALLDEGGFDWKHVKKATS